MLFAARDTGPSSQIDFTIRGNTVIHVLAYDLKEPNDTANDYARVISAIKSESHGATLKNLCG